MKTGIAGNPWSIFLSFDVVKNTGLPAIPVFDIVGTTIPDISRDSVMQLEDTFAISGQRRISITDRVVYSLLVVLLVERFVPP